MNGALAGIVEVLTAIVGVAALAVIFAPRANTANVITATGTAFAGGVAAAVSPVQGGIVTPLRPMTNQGWG